MGKLENIADKCLLTIGTVVGLANIEHILGIVILIIQIAWILTKLVVKVINYIKSDKPLDSLDGDVDSVIDKIDEFKDTLKTTEDTEENGQDNE